MTDYYKKPVVKITGDGSTSLYSPEFDQLYHNPHGAVSENRHVFFEKNGLQKALQEQSKVNIFEVGFGTGLNLLLILDCLREKELEAKVSFYSVEAFPIDPAITEDFDYKNEPGLRKSLLILRSILKKLKTGMNRIQVTSDLTLYFYFGFFSELFSKHEQSPLISDKMDFIFHDPFSPEVNPELWTPRAFEKLASICNKDAVLSTYCAASSARAAMALAGWKVARAPGAVGKREMTLASLDSQKLETFKRINEARLAERFEGDFDE